VLWGAREGTQLGGGASGARGCGARRPLVALRPDASRDVFSGAGHRHARCGEPAAAAATAAASGFSQTRVAPRFEWGISPLASSVEMTRAEQRPNHATTGASWRPGLDRHPCPPVFQSRAHRRVVATELGHLHLSPSVLFTLTPRPNTEPHHTNPPLARPPCNHGDSIEQRQGPIQRQRRRQRQDSARRGSHHASSGGSLPLASSVEMTRAEQRPNLVPTGASWRPGLDRHPCRPSFNLVPTGASWRPSLVIRTCRLLSFSRPLLAPTPNHTTQIRHSHAALQPR
jgi:hypothetical protein